MAILRITTPITIPAGAGFLNASGEYKTTGRKSTINRERGLCLVTVKDTSMGRVACLSANKRVFVSDVPDLTALVG